MFMVAATSTGMLTVEDVNKTLEDTLNDVFKSNRFQDLLKVIANMKSYSFNNTLLIAAQKPEATMVKGFKEWQKEGRFVDKGEKGLRILAPLVGKVQMEKIDKETKKPVIDSKGNAITEDKKVIKGFKMVSVFDVSQTSGKEIPSVRDFISREMSNDEYMSQLYRDYKSFLTDTRGMDIKEAETDKGVGGYYRRSTDEIVISSTTNTNDTEKFRVLVHEYAHYSLHNENSEMKNLPRGHKEAQAESVAFVVSNYYGMDSADISAGYIATWAQSMTLAKQAITEIQSVANSIIEDVDHLQKEKIMNFYKDQSKDYDEAKTMLLDKVGLSEKVFNAANAEETRLQLIHKENGYILSGKIEYNEKNENFYLRTNRNMIEPLSELSENGSLKVLKVEKELGKMNSITEIGYIPGHFEIKDAQNGSFVIQSKAGETVISKAFAEKVDAEKFQLRAAVSQSLHETTMIKNELKFAKLNEDLQRTSNEVNNQVNQSVGNYLSVNSGKTVKLEGESGVTVGWALLKNPKVNTLSELETFSKEHKHVPSYKKLPEALNQIHESEKKSDKVIVKEVHELQIER